MLIDVSTSRGMAIASALRGPDDASGGYLTKIHTTAVIRYFCDVSSDDCEVRSPAEAMGCFTNLSPDFRGQMVEFLNNNSHFHAHLCAAFSELGGEANRYWHWLMEQLKA